MVSRVISSHATCCAHGECDSVVVYHGVVLSPEAASWYGVLCCVVRRDYMRPHHFVPPLAQSDLISVSQCDMVWLYRLVSSHRYGIVSSRGLWRLLIVSSRGYGALSNAASHGTEHRITSHRIAHGTRQSAIAHHITPYYTISMKR